MADKIGMTEEEYRMMKTALWEAFDRGLNNKTTNTNNDLRTLQTMAQTSIAIIQLETYALGGLNK